MSQLRPAVEWQRLGSNGVSAGAASSSHKENLLLVLGQFYVRSACGEGLQPGKGLSARTPLPAGARVCRPTGKVRPPGKELTCKALVGTYFLKEHCDPMFLKLCFVKCESSVRY